MFQPSSATTNVQDTLDAIDSEEAARDQFDNLASLCRQPPSLTDSSAFECEELLARVTPEEVADQTFEMDDDCWQCGLA